MNEWTSGYVDGIDYTHDFYRELTPALLAFTALCHGWKFEPSAAKPTYCELGCGQGFSTNLLGAANPGIEFHATDFNPAHIACARSLAEEAGLKNVHFYEHAFAEFAHEPALPASFDIIVLHGVYSWISAENRQHIVDFIARRLRPGGLAFVSYNAMPGWATALPLRRILVDHASKESGPIASRIDGALNFADALREVDAGYFTHNASIAPRLKRMMTMPRNYLAHEYFNRDWTPFYFKDVVTELSNAKLTYAGTTDLLGTIDELSLAEHQRHLLSLEKDPLYREALRDVIVNQQFRTDLFIKGGLSHSARSAAGAWLAMRFVLSVLPGSVPSTIKGRLGAIALDMQRYQPVLDAFATGPLSVRELLQRGVFGNRNWGEIMETLTLLVGAGHLQPCLPEDGIANRVDSCRGFNRAVCKQAEDNENLRFLASPVSGGGLSVDRYEQLFLIALAAGRKQPEEWASSAWSVLAPQGQRLLKEDRVLNSDADNLAELTRRAESFARHKLPVCESMQISI